HAHTSYSDGTLSPISLVRQAERRGLDVVAVTEHNGVLAGRIARGFSEIVGGPAVIVGEEVTTGSFHLVALGLERTVSPLQSLPEVVADVHAQGGVAVAAHPVARYHRAFDAVRGDLDGVEVMHPVAFGSGGPGWRWSDMVAFYNETSPPPAAIGSSDYHLATVLGLCRTLVFVEGEPSSASVLAALRARRTVVLGPGGERFGDPALLALLDREPYEPRTSDYAYRGEGLGDRLLRLLGLVGVALAAFARAPSLRRR
ncbi:MAG: CehA/McbA family metallohydrolase, partial [Myxococcales bacterium]|nr:CehA/McbA family metallohydrolase [Myxococcales bacterium]